VTELQVALASAMSEVELQDTYVRPMAEAQGWLCYHTHESRRSPAGFPDLVLVSAARGRLIFAECKSQAGQVRPDQRAWIVALEAIAGTRFDVTLDRLGFEAGPMLPEVYVWRPSHWLDGTIERLLR